MSLVNAMVVGAVNLVLDPLLMFGFGLGVTGAAMATAAAQWVRDVLLLRDCYFIGVYMYSHPFQTCR